MKDPWTYTQLTAQHTVQVPSHCLIAPWALFPSSKNLPCRQMHCWRALPALWNKGLNGWCHPVSILLSLNQSLQLPPLSFSLCPHLSVSFFANLSIQWNWFLLVFEAACSICFLFFSALFSKENCRSGVINNLLRMVLYITWWEVYPLGLPRTSLKPCNNRKENETNSRSTKKRIVSLQNVLTGMIYRSTNQWLCEFNTYVWWFTT